MKDDKESKKKPLTIKEIGLPKIITLVAVGIFLLVLSVPELFSVNSEEKETQTGVQTSLHVGNALSSNDAFIQSQEQKLEQLLKKVDGVGDVKVMLTLKSSKEQVALKDTNNSQISNTETDSAGGNRNSSDTNQTEETVMSQTGSGESSPYVVKEIEPQVEGVLVIARGGDDAKVISEINSAVQVLFGVPAHKIKVMKMI